MSAASALGLIGFVALCTAVASSGAIFRAGAWSRALARPPWAPPPWAFGPIWAVLYALIAVAGWRVWREVGLAAWPLGIYAVQLGFNGAWSACFFGLRRPDAAFADIVLLWLSVAGTIAAFAPVDALAAGLLAPYLAWVTIAAALNWSIWRRNRATLGLL